MMMEGIEDQTEGLTFEGRLLRNVLRLLDRHALREISGLIDILTTHQRRVIRQQLEWDRGEERREQG